MKFFLVIGFLIALFCYNVFSATPFLQHEIFGQVYWWNHSDFGFWETLFDGMKMDSGFGRFRYIEYLAEAFYWKLMVGGFLPKDLYDYFGLLTVGICAFFLYKISKEKNLKPLEIALCLAFFLLSTHAFLAVVFHFRKAKAIVAILFVLILWVSEKPWKPFWSAVSLGVIGFLGFFSDPYFILPAPAFVLSLDFARKNYSRSTALLTGMATAFFALLIINGAIGPRIHPNTKLVFHNFDGKPPGVLSMSQLPEFPRILQDMVLPAYAGKIGWGLVGFFFLILFLQIRKRAPEWGLTLGFLVTLPVCAFLIVPVENRFSYSGYYGYPLLILLTVLFMNICKFLRTYFSPSIYFAGLTAILLLICIHQSNQKIAFRHWVDHQLLPKGGEPRVMADYQEFKKIAKFFRENPNGRYALQLDTRNINIRLGSNIYFDEDSLQKHTDLAYILIPLVFRREIQKGQLSLEFPRKP
jgi:hypothetical protein